MLCEAGTSSPQVNSTWQCPIPSIGTVNALVSLLVEGILEAQCNISQSDDWPPDYADQAKQQELDIYDFVVIGAGSAGSVVASRLSENPEWKVLVIEAGDDPPQESEIPLLASSLLNTQASYNYRVESNGLSCKAFENHQCRWSRGNCVGGTGSINGMVYVRGNPEDHDHWCSEGLEGWCYEDVRPYYEKSVIPQGNIQDPKGSLILNQVEPIDDIVTVIAKGWEELNHELIQKFGNDNYIRYNYPNLTYQQGHRMSTGKTFLGKVGKRKNLQVIKNAIATKLLFDKEGKKVNSVEFVIRGTTAMHVQVSKEVIVSSGALESPKLLMLSGIGSKEMLNDLNIRVIHDLPIGQNLQDHIIINLYLRMPARSSEQSNTVLENIYQYLIHKRGPFSTLPTGQQTAYLKVNRSSVSSNADMQAYLVNLEKGDTTSLELIANNTGMRIEFKDVLKKEIAKDDLIIVYVLLSRPKSRGIIKLRSADYRKPPIIESGYLEHPKDREMLKLGVNYIEQLLDTSVFKKENINMIHIPIKECDKFRFRSLKYWLCYISYFTTTGYHYAGTIKMGLVTDKTSCVDSQLRVKGIDNLRVADASIMSYVTSHNTNAPTIMIAEKAADLVRHQWLV